MYYEVFLYDFQNNEVERTHFIVEWGDSVCDGLEDALFIKWELEPKSRDWKQELRAKGYTIFTYHGVEDFVVRYAWKGSGMIYVNQVSPDNNA